MYGWLSLASGDKDPASHRNRIRKGPKMRGFQLAALLFELIALAAAPMLGKLITDLDSDEEHGQEYTNSNRK